MVVSVVVLETTGFELELEALEVELVVDGALALSVPNPEVIAGSLVSGPEHPTPKQTTSLRAMRESIRYFMTDETIRTSDIYINTTRKVTSQGSCLRLTS